jgi:hypothetical protein
MSPHAQALAMEERAIGRQDLLGTGSVAHTSGTPNGLGLVTKMV